MVAQHWHTFTLGCTQNQKALPPGCLLYIFVSTEASLIKNHRSLVLRSGQRVCMCRIWRCIICRKKKEIKVVALDDWHHTLEQLIWCDLTSPPSQREDTNLF